MPKVPYTKPALSHQDQIDQLKKRGLIIENEPKALNLLENISYYRLSGYWYPMLGIPKSTHKFKPGSTFTNAFRLYCFDRELRKLVIGELEKIEVAIRAKMIYTLSHRYGAFWFKDFSLVNNPNKLRSSLAKIQNETSRSDEEFIKHFKNKYSDPYPPSWMTLEISSFGTLSYLYQNLKPLPEKKAIAHHFGVDNSTLESWLHSFVYVRNVCAHHTRLWNRRMSISPRVPLNPANTFLSITHTTNPRTGKQDPINKRSYFLFSLIIYLLNIINPKHTFKERLIKLIKKYPSVDVKAMGFPDMWEAEALWKNKYKRSIKEKILLWLNNNGV